MTLSIKELKRMTKADIIIYFFREIVTAKRCVNVTKPFECYNKDCKNRLCVLNNNQIKGGITK